MPLSRNGKLYFTEEQYARARACSALEYAGRQRYDLVQDGGTYYLREHDSMVFTKDGRWFWNSRKLSGRALEFMQHYEDLSLPEAVVALTEGGHTYSTAPLEQEYKPKEPFELPIPSDSYKRLFAYLCGVRGLDSGLIKRLIHDGRLYESGFYKDRKSGELKEAHNAVFVGLDKVGCPRSAFQRGLNSQSKKPFKREVAGSEKRYPFCVPGLEGVETVGVFEASIDAISHATLDILQGRDYRRMDRIALGGLDAAPLFQYLMDHPGVRRIILFLDNDTWGRQGAEKIQASLGKMGYRTDRGYETDAEWVPGGKDWNEYLVTLRHQKEGDVHGRCAAPER